MDSKRVILISMTFTLAIVIIVSSLASLAVLPHSLFDLLEPSVVELKTKAGKPVFSQVSRLNTLALPNDLESGTYELYVNGHYQDEISIQGTVRQEEELPRESVPRLEVRNVGSTQAVTWNKARTNDSLLEFGPASELAGQWINQQKVMLAEINIPIMSGAVIVLITLTAFNLSALINSLAKGDDNVVDYIRNGWEPFVPVLATVSAWTVVLTVITVPVLAILSMVNIIPYHGETIVIPMAIAWLSWEVLAPNAKRFPFQAAIIIICGLTGLLVNNLILATMVSLILAHLIAPFTATAPQVEEERSQAWKESLR
jgi:hypothetical protein